MFHYAKESGGEQEIGSKGLKFSEISVVSVTTMETLVVFHGVVELPAQKRKVPQPYCPNLSQGEPRGRCSWATAAYQVTSITLVIITKWFTLSSHPSCKLRFLLLLLKWVQFYSHLVAGREPLHISYPAQLSWPAVAIAATWLRIQALNIQSRIFDLRLWEMIRVKNPALEDVKL